MNSKKISSVLFSLLFTVIQVGCDIKTTSDDTNPISKKIGQLQTRTTHEIESSNWSVGGETMDRDYTIYKNWSPYLEDLGIKKVRLQGGWAKCEKEKGIYSWGWLDEPIFDLPKKGITPWVCLCYGNPIYGDGEIVLGSKIFTDEESMNAWLSWVKATVNRYKDVVTIWEVWNEPNGHNPVEAYANLLIKTSNLIKEIQPEATIIGYVEAGIDLKFAEEGLKYVKENGNLKNIDYFCYHPYSFNPDDSYPTVEKLQEIVQKYAPHMKLFQGENGAPSEYRTTKALSRYEWTELTQAKWALRRMLGDLGRDIPTSIFSIVDLKYPDEMNRKGLLYANDDKTVSHKKQAYFAVQNLAAIFDHSLMRNKDFGFTAETEHKHTAFGFTNKSNGQHLVTTWLHTNRPTDYNATTPVSMKFENCSFTKPLLVDLRTGDVFEINKNQWSQNGNSVDFSSLPVYDSPIVIAESSLIKLK